MAYAPAVALKLPWAAVLGNHDQEGTLSREGVMQHIVGMPLTLSKLNPSGMDIDGFGNYNLEVAGAEGSSLSNKSVLNLYFVDSGDYSTIPSIPGYGWIKPSQQVWFQQTSSHLQVHLKKKCNYSYPVIEIQSLQWLKLKFAWIWIKKFYNVIKLKLLESMKISFTKLV